MDAQQQTPRVTAAHLEQFTGKTVRIIGKVVQLRGDQATINASGNVTISLDRNSHLTVNNFVEVVGKVAQDGSIKTLMATDFGKDIDMNAVEAVVDATHRYKDLFYDTGN